MKLIRPYFEIITQIDREQILKKIELCGRVCYKSEDKITENSGSVFVKSVKAHNHFSVLEHEIITVKIVCDRGVSHELVRHRIASFSQESTRYCNYSKDKFGNQLTFIIPVWLCDLKEGQYGDIEIEDYKKNNVKGKKITQEWRWLWSMKSAEDIYLLLLINGWTPQQARSVLPNSLKTEIVITANLREWMHIFSLRCANDAHPQMREIMLPLKQKFSECLSELFN